MRSVDNLSYKKKIELICGTTIILIGLGFSIILIPVGTVGVWIFSIVTLALGGYLTYDAIKGKERISYSTFISYKEPAIYVALSNNCSRYKNYLVNDDESYMYNELCKKFPGLFAEYTSNILHAPLEMYKPVSSTTAAYVGTKIGGLAVGLAAAQEAERKKLVYEQNVRDVIRSKLSVGNAHDKVEYCFNEMVRIIKKNEKARNDWETIEKAIDDELYSKYIVR